MNACNHLESVLHNEIPLTQSMEISVKHCDSSKVELSAPLTPNINHKCTAFGGSLYSIAVLCGWSFIYQQMQINNLSGHIVIQHSEVDYNKPVDGKISAVCELVDEKVITRFIKTVKRKGRGRIKLSVKVLYKGNIAVQFLGHYVVHQ